MTSSWPEVVLGPLCTKVGSGATPRGGKEAYKSEGIALIRSQNVLNDGFTGRGLAFIDEKQASTLSNVTVEEGDILLNITGDSVARSCIVPRWVLPARVNQHVSIIRPDPEKLSSHFLRYVMISPDMQRHLLSLASAGATRNALTKRMLEGLIVPCPPMREQQAIAEILGALDDKIQLNRRMNATLDELARTISRSWFIDFDPVRAKVEGREPFGMDAETAALFPDHLAESSLGPTPVGWGVKTLADAVTLGRISVKPQDNPATEYFHYSIPAFDAGDTPEVELGETIRSSKYLVPENSVLLSKLNPRIQRIWVPSSPDGSGREAIASTEFLVLIPKEDIPRSFITTLVSNQAFQDRFASLVSGTSNSHQRVRPKDAERIPFVLPPQDILKKFAERVEPLYELFLSNRNENRTLAKLRDTLLPELISGRIRVPDAEKAVAEVV